MRLIIALIISICVLYFPQDAYAGKKGCLGIGGTGATQIKRDMKGSIKSTNFRTSDRSDMFKHPCLIGADIPDSVKDSQIPVEGPDWDEIDKAVDTNLKEGLKNSKQSK